MIRVLSRAHQEERDVVEVGAVWLLVDRALVELGITGTRLDRVHMDHRKSGEEDFVVRLHETPSPPIPCGSVEKQTVDVDALLDTNTC